MLAYNSNKRPPIEQNTKLGQEARINLLKLKSLVHLEERNREQQTS